MELIRPVEFIMPSDNKIAVVNRLPLFDLDNISIDPKLIGPYTYTVKMGDEEYIIEYDLEAVEDPPKEPTVNPDSIEEGTDEWWDAKEYLTYRAAKAHELIRLKAIEDYFKEVAKRVLEECVPDEVKKRIITEADWEATTLAAVIGAVEMEDLAAVLRSTFPSQFRR